MSYSKLAEDIEWIRQEREAMGCSRGPVIIQPVQPEQEKQSSAPQSNVAGWILRCKDCKSVFVFSPESHQFYTERGWAAPVRCKKCRKARKQARKTQKN